MSRAVIDAKEFSHAMSKISKILKKCAIPILEEVCLQIQNGRCTLTATDLETWLIQKLLEAFDKEETIDLSIIDWDAFQIENVTPENYEWVYHRVFDGWIQGFIHYCRKAPVFRRQERSFF